MPPWVGVRSVQDPDPEDTIRALPFGLLAVATLVIGLILVRQRQESLREERQPADTAPQVVAPLDLDLVRSAGL